MKTKTSPTKIAAFTAAVGLACFSGSVATVGLAKFCPGAELVVVVMGGLFEVGKLSAFAMIHRQIPGALKAALLAVGLVLMGLNVMGVAGFLSAAYERTHVAAQAASHTAERTAHASASLVDRQLAQAEGNLSQARSALIKAKDDKGRQKAAQAVVTSATQ